VTFAPSLGIDIGTFTETRSGLFYKDVRTGQGGVAGTGSFVNFFVQGWYVDGTEFQPRITMNNVRMSAGELIAGVDEALQGMRPGGERIAVVPPGLGYGRGQILVFRLELTGVQ
jgi:FKBP-type peptidyl-prolyl cis-trans isomerase